MTTTNLLTRHPLDEAVALAHQAATAEAHGADAPQRYRGHTHPAYGNMIGPFGGITAAQALQAVMQHPHRLGEPVSFTVNFAAALAEGAFDIEARPVRTNRSTQHWLVSITQAGADGVESTVLTATAVTAVRRATWSAADAVMPTVPAPHQVERPGIVRGVEWVKRYDIRPCAGHVPSAWDGTEADSVTQIWMRDNPPRPLDYLSLTALADVFFPRVWRRRALRTPVGTVSMTVYYHASSAELAATGEGYLLGHARAQSFFNGFFDQSAELWNEAGHLLATSHQIVYYKE